MGEGPKLVSRREHKKSNFKLGRTIGEKREKLETANERAAARKKDKQKKALRVIITTFGFIALAAILFGLYFFFTKNSAKEIIEEEGITEFNPTIEIIDESSLSNDKITSRMKKYIGQIEKDLHDLGYKAEKAVVPADSIRVINLYLDGYTGFVKVTIDRDSAVSAEDIDRMLRYLSENEITDFNYIDVRIDGKAYWK